MAADNSTFVAGHFTATFGGTPIGTTETGFNLEIVGPNVDPIKIDDLGDTTADGIWRGYNVRLRFECIQYGTAYNGTGLGAFQFPFDTTVGTIQGIGQTIVGSFAKQLVLTPVSGINSHLQTWTFPLTMADRDHGGINMNTKNTHLRCNLMVYPSTNNVLFTKV